MTAPATSTPKRRLIEERLRSNIGIGIEAYVAAQQADGVAWQAIADRISELTGEDLPRTTLLSWLT